MMPLSQMEQIKAEDCMSDYKSSSTKFDTNSKSLMLLKKMTMMRRMKMTLTMRMRVSVMSQKMLRVVKLVKMVMASCI